MNDYIAETHENIAQIRQPRNKKPTEYVEALWNKMIACEPIYDEYELRELSTNGIPESIENSMFSF